MPKPGKFHNNNRQSSWKSQYHHDDPRADGFDSRRVSFKTNRSVFRKPTRDLASAVRAHLDDEDIDMGASSGGGRTFSRKYNKGRGGGRPNGPPPKRKLFDNPMGWFQVTIPYGNKYEKEFLMKTLTEHTAPLNFWPIAWIASGPSATFYVDDFKVAEKLNDLSREIALPDGFRLIIRVGTGIPTVDINAEMTEKIKLAMAKRYNGLTKALDLTKFHADPDLQLCFCALFKPNVLLTVIDIISENIPELEALNLGDNRITNVACLKNMIEKLPNLKVLHLGNNKFRDLALLDPFVGLPIIDLLLNGNPLCSKYKDQDVYVGEVRKKFPKVIKLDGIDLPPPISFDICEETPLPPGQQTFLCNPEGEPIVRQFLEQYFLIFDGDTRAPLSGAYHENALFSMTMSNPYRHRDNVKSTGLNWYKSDNRNLLYVNDPNRRLRLLKDGQKEIIKFLRAYPPTKHDIHSFTVDLVLFTPHMISLTLSGMYKETQPELVRSPPIRWFFRTLVIVPAGTGFCIINETLHITNATPDQAKNAFKTVVTVPEITATTPAPTPASSPAALMMKTIDDATKQQMVQAMAEQSGMNLDWSGRCLQETEWDFPRALGAFTEAHNKGVIPAEAFSK